MLLAPKQKEIDDIAERIIKAKYEAVAIGFMHSYANTAHELMMEKALRKRNAALSISISSQISPQIRELQRFNTVIANAYVQPQISAYLGRLAQTLKSASLKAPIFMIHSGGGLISLETAAKQPIRLLESGPAGGAIFAANFARAHALDKVLSFDMGGTTAKICLIEDGEPKTANTFEIARTYRFKKGSGMSVSTPVVEMVEIGAGGGSIASIDSLGRIQVGPQSAGSEPGPACYQRGGTEPTVTDANLQLGRLDPDNFAGGAIPLSADFADRAITKAISKKMNITSNEAAFGITEAVDENMANAARVHTVENGRDIEHYTMVAFGGGAPLHACRLCEKLTIKALIIPPGAGVGSAIGFLKAPFSYEATKGLFQHLDAFDAKIVNRQLKALHAEALSFVREGAPKTDYDTKLTAFMRYSGQGWEIPVQFEYRDFTSEDVPHIKESFEKAYGRLFGRIIEGLSIEITNWSLVVATKPIATKKIKHLAKGKDLTQTQGRKFFDAGLRRLVDASVVAREAMTAGVRVDGPAIIIERETSTIVTSSFYAVGQHDGSLSLLSKEAFS